MYIVLSALQIMHPGLLVHSCIMDDFVLGWHGRRPARPPWLMSASIMPSSRVDLGALQTILVESVVHGYDTAPRSALTVDLALDK